MSDVWIVVGGDLVLKKRRAAGCGQSFCPGEILHCYRYTFQPSKRFINVGGGVGFPGQPQAFITRDKVNQRIHVRIKNLDLLEKGIHDLDARDVT